MEFINIPSHIENKESFLTALQTVANTLDFESIQIMSRFCIKNNKQSSQLVKDLSTNFMTKKYF